MSLAFVFEQPVLLLALVPRPLLLFVEQRLVLLQSALLVVLARYAGLPVVLVILLVRRLQRPVVLRVARLLIVLRLLVRLPLVLRLLVQQQVVLLQVFLVRFFVLLVQQQSVRLLLLQAVLPQYERPLRLRLGRQLLKPPVVLRFLLPWDP